MTRQVSLDAVGAVCERKSMELFRANILLEARNDELEAELRLKDARIAELEKRLAEPASASPQSE